MSRYYCADGRRIEGGHDIEECPPCLRAMRDGIRREYEANVNVDLVARLHEMDYRIAQQRRELARLNEAVAGPPSPVKVTDAFVAWCLPNLESGNRRFASVAFREGWHAARRAIMPACAREDRKSEPNASKAEKGWRVGRKLGRTIYLNGTCVGMVDSEEIAQVLVTSATDYFERASGINEPKPTASLVGMAEKFIVEQSTRMALGDQRDVIADLACLLADVHTLGAREVLLSVSKEKP